MEIESVKMGIKQHGRAMKLAV